MILTRFFLWLMRVLMFATVFWVCPIQAGGNLSGDESKPDRWPDTVWPIRWYLSAEGIPNSGITNAQVAAQLQAAFNSWQALPASKVAFEYGGEVPRNKKAQDGQYLITFTDNTVEFPPEVLAMAWNWSFPQNVTTNVKTGQLPAGSYPAGTIYDADITYNISNMPSIGSGNDIQMVALHEIGHTLGLSHSSIPEASMFPFAHANIQQGRQLALDDIAYASYYYPEPYFYSTYGLLKGRIIGGDRRPILGAHVYVADKTNGKKLVGAYSLANGEYRLPAMTGSYYVGIEPLDGDPAGLDPYRINKVVANTQDTYFPTEFYDANEASVEADPKAAIPISVNAGLTTANINLITNTANYSGVVRQFSPGINYFTYPVAMPSQLKAFDLLKALGTEEEISAIDRFNPSTQALERAAYYSGVPQGVNFEIEPGVGYSVHALVQKSVTFAGEVDCPNHNLAVGLNLLGVNCPQNNYGAHQLLEDLGTDETAVAVTRVDNGEANITQHMAYANSQPSGQDFPIVNGEAYFAHMKSPSEGNVIKLSINSFKSSALMK